MLIRIPIAAVLLGELASAASSLASCSTTLTANRPAPSVADGYVARLVAKNLTAPRGIMFDKQGNLLVVEQLSGIVALTFNDDGNGCLSEKSRKTVINDTTLNHGIEQSPDGNTLYASSSDILYSWDYSPQSMSNTSAPKTLIQNMEGEDHTTRTLLLSKFAPGLMIVTRGSSSNLDEAAADLSSGHSQIKAFNLTNLTGTYDFNNDGLMLGWGLRNDVGIDEEPITGGIYSVENGADQIDRNGQDIHQDNPAEELNFLGYLNGTHSPNQGRNFGYPQCFTAWNPSSIPSFNGSVGDPFAVGNLSSTLNDTTCDAANRQTARLAFQAHMAPLDILFNPAGTAAWVSFHGSWDRNDPVGYKVSVLAFADGEPVAPRNSSTAAVDVFANPDNSKCPDACFRPVGLAWDSQGRLFVSSDATGEIYVLLREDGSATSGVGSNATGTIPANGTSTVSGAPSATSSKHNGAAGAAGMSFLAVLCAVAAFWL